MTTPEEAKGLFGSLFDFSFSSFITTKIIKYLYGIAIAASGLVSLFLVGMGFQQGAFQGVFALIIGAPLFFLLSVMYVRVILELLIVVFRIAEHTAQIARQGQGQPRGEEQP